MTTQSEREAQTHATRDLFAAYAEQMVDGYPEPSDDFDATVIRATLWNLTDTDDPLAFDVLQAIHAERRRRLSEKTRGERRNAD